MSKFIKKSSTGINRTFGGQKNSLPMVQQVFRKKVIAETTKIVSLSVPMFLLNYSLN